MWFPEKERRIYTDPRGKCHDPLELRQALVLETGGMVWAFAGKRHDLFKALNTPGLDVGAEAAAEGELARIETKLAALAFKVWGLTPISQAWREGSDGRGEAVATGDEALALLDHFLGWLAQKKDSTAASQNC
jgi:hypothetical protein